MRTKPLTDQELRDRGVPEEVIEKRRSPHRVWVAPLRGLAIDGERTPTIDERREVVRQAVTGRSRAQRLDDLERRMDVALARYPRID